MIATAASTNSTMRSTASTIMAASPAAMLGTEAASETSAGGMMLPALASVGTEADIAGMRPFVTAAPGGCVRDASF